MTALAIVALTSGFVILVLSGIITSLIRSNKSLVRALIARNSHEVVVLDQSEAKADAAKPTLPMPFSRRPLPPEQDDYDVMPLGLSG